MEAIQVASQHAQQFAAHTALSYLNDHKMEDQTKEFVDALFAHGTLGEAVLSELRRMEGKQSSKASDYLVVLRGEVSADDYEPAQEWIEEDGGAPYFYRSFRVLADSEDDAGQFAIRYAKRVDDMAADVDKVELMESGIEAHTGVWMESEKWITRRSEAEGS